MKYKNKVGEAIRMLTKPKFNYPNMPIAKKEMNKDVYKIEGKQNKMQVFLWEKTGKLQMNSKKNIPSNKKCVSFGHWTVLAGT